MTLSNVINPQPGWYRGNFHSHTNFSEDGYHSPAELIDIAREEGLDFFAVTDHNSIDAHQAFSPAPQDLLVIPGIEVTLTDGHFNVFGLPGWLDWMEHICIGQSTIKLNGQFGSTTELMRQIVSQGLISSINHPRRGLCEWRDGGTNLRYVDCLEIWNKPSYDENDYANPEAVALWTAWLNAGHRTTAVGGSDFHGAPGERLGTPSTYVYAAELSGQAVLAGLRQRRAYLSMGPQVQFQARVNGSAFEMGADLGQPQADIWLKAGITDNYVSGYARIIKNGQVLTETPIEHRQASLHVRDRAHPAKPAWYRLDVVDRDGRMLAITNPFFAGPRREPALERFGDFDNLT